MRRGKSKRPPLPYYFTLVDPILDTIESKLDTKYIKGQHTGWDNCYHKVYNNSLKNTRKGFYKVLHVGYEFRGCHLKILRPNKNSTMPTLNLRLIFGLLKLMNISSILEKMQSNGIFLQEPTVSSFKNPMTGFTR